MYWISVMGFPLMFHSASSITHSTNRRQLIRIRLWWAFDGKDHQSTGSSLIHRWWDNCCANPSLISHHIILMNCIGPDGYCMVCATITFSCCVAVKFLLFQVEDFSGEFKRLLLNLGCAIFFKYICCKVYIPNKRSTLFLVKCFSFSFRLLYSIF